MKYQLRFTDRYNKQFGKLDFQTKKLIFSWLEKHIHNTKNPRLHGKSLVGNKRGLWRYRVGNYRVIVDIRDNELLILALEVGHRKNIY